MSTLSVVASQWKAHLLTMDHLKERTGLRGYGQSNPLVEYKRESFEMFEAMMQRFQEETVRYLYLLQVIEAEPQRQQAAAPSDGLSMDGVPFDPTRPVAPPPGGNGNRHRAATSMDDMEREFRRKKQRERQAARMAAAGHTAGAQRRVADKIGGHEPGPRGAGKSYK